MTREPDNWVIFKYKLPDNTEVYRLLVGWSSSYLYGSSWKINSGIRDIKKEDDYYIIEGFSGSEYKCHKEQYCLRMNNAHIFKELEQTYGAEILPNQPDWENFKWPSATKT
jgi:hypothetical protein